MIWLLLIVMYWWSAGIPAAMAQTGRAKKSTAAPAPQSNKWPVKSLKVEGNQNYTQSQILAVAGMKVGQLAGKPEFEAARDRLVATGSFETVGYKFAPSGDQNGYVPLFRWWKPVPHTPSGLRTWGFRKKT